MLYICLHNSISAINMVRYLKYNQVGNRLSFIAIRCSELLYEMKPMLLMKATVDRGNFAVRAIIAWTCTTKRKASLLPRDIATHVTGNRARVMRLYRSRNPCPTSAPLCNYEFTSAKWSDTNDFVSRWTCPRRGVLSASRSKGKINIRFLKKDLLNVSL